jgi:uncharacterized protein
MAMEDVRTQTRDEIVSTIRRRAARIQALGASALYLYGSRARGDNRDDSDLDVMVDHVPGKLALFDLLAIKHIIEDDTGLEVHIATSDSFKPEKRHRFERDLLRVL